MWICFHESYVLHEENMHIVCSTWQNKDTLWMLCEAVIIATNQVTVAILWVGHKQALPYSNVLDIVVIILLLLI